MIRCEQIDTNRLFLALDEIRAAMLAKGMDASNLVQDQTRLLDRQLVNITPPIRGQGGSGSPRLNGEARISKELCSLFSEVDPHTIDEVGSLHGIHNVDAYITGKNGARIHLQWENIDPTGDRMKEYHDKFRGRHGTVKIVRRTMNPWTARVVVPLGTREPYIRKVQERVGTAKCSMSMVGQRLGDNYPGWITRQNDRVISKNSFILEPSDAKSFGNLAFPSITFGSRAPGITGIRDRAQAAVRLRVNAMRRRIKLILSDYKDWRTVRSKAQSRGHSNEEPEHVE